MKILVIEAFGLHVGYLGCYGNEWVATPHLDRLAVDGVVFDWHIVDRPELTPSVQLNLGEGWRVVRCASLERTPDANVSSSLRANTTECTTMYFSVPLAFLLASSDRPAAQSMSNRARVFLKGSAST